MKISVITCSIRPKGLAITQKGLQNQTFTDYEWITEIGLPPKHDLNAAYNRALKRVTGELVVSLQDYIKIPPDYLEKFWKAHLEDPQFYTAPVGKTQDWKNITWDWRHDWKKDEPLAFYRWECDSASAPLAALKDIGGFDEELDKHWSYDNVSVGKRAQLKGYKIKLLQDNPAIAFDHDASIKHPFRDRFNPDAFNERMRQIEMGEVTIKYL